MSAILSIDDLNDFISPGVACIKPIEAIPETSPPNAENPYEVTTEEKSAAQNPTPAQISLTDCLACSGCVTSAEAILVSLQSHLEVLETLDRNRSVIPAAIDNSRHSGAAPLENGTHPSDGKVFIASVSPQTKASLAAAYGVSFADAGHMIEQLLSGESGLRTGGRHGTDFLWVVDTTRLRDMALVLSADEVLSRSQGASTNGLADQAQRSPVLASACPGWICYVEKTHPELISCLSAVKSPQSLTGTLLKSILWKVHGIPPDRVWHLAVMPCFDKKLEASRAELTSAAWVPQSSTEASPDSPVRDVDCVITPRELLSIAEARGIDFASLPRRPVMQRASFPDPTIHTFLFPSHSTSSPQGSNGMSREHGTSGGFLAHVAKRVVTIHPGSRIRVSQGRNADVLEMAVESIIPDRPSSPIVHFSAARYYGFRNIQNLVRKLKTAPHLQKKQANSSRLLKAAQASKNLSGLRTPATMTRNKIASGGSQYSYVEVMACPGGCINGGGQLGVRDLEELKLREVVNAEDRPADETAPDDGSSGRYLPTKREWIAQVEDLYFSTAEYAGTVPTDGSVSESTQGLNADDSPDATKETIVDGISYSSMYSLIDHWSRLTDVEPDQLVRTTYRDVSANDILSKKSNAKAGRSSAMDDEIVAGLAVKVGGGW